MSKKIKELQARQRAIQDEFCALYEKAEKRELTTEEIAQEKALNREFERNERELSMLINEGLSGKLTAEPEKSKSQMLREFLKGSRSGSIAREITLSPVEGAPGANIVESGAINLTIHDLIPTLNEGLDLPRNLQLVTGVVGDEVWPISANDVKITEEGENVRITPQNLKFTNIKAVSRRCSLAVLVSNRAIDNAAFDILPFVQRKFDLAVRKYLAMKLYSQAAFTGNKGPFSGKESSGTIILNDDAYINILKAIAQFRDRGFSDDSCCLVMDAVTEAELMATPKAFGQGGFIIENGKCAGHEYIVSHYINTTLGEDDEVAPTPDRYLGIGFFEWEAVQQHDTVRMTIDATSQEVALINSTAVVINTAWSFTELKPYFGGDGSVNSAFGLYKIVPATE